MSGTLIDAAIVLAPHDLHSGFQHRAGHIVVAGARTGNAVLRDLHEIDLLSIIERDRAPWAAPT